MSGVKGRSGRPSLRAEKRGIELVYEAFHQPASGRDICQIYAPEGIQIQITRKLRKGDGEDLVVDKVLGKE